MYLADFGFLSDENATSVAESFVSGGGASGDPRVELSGSSGLAESSRGSLGVGVAIFHRDDIAGRTLELGAVVRGFGKEMMKAILDGL